MAGWETRKPTGVLVLPDGTSIFGFGIGTVGAVAGEVCFNTAITGYQEILTDPSYSGQIVTFTFPHIGNVGTNSDDTEITNTNNEDAALGLIIREDITLPANYRSVSHLNDWLSARNLIGLSGVDNAVIDQPYPRKRDV